MAEEQSGEEQGDWAQVPCPGCKQLTLSDVENRGVYFVGCNACYGLFAQESDLGIYVTVMAGDSAAEIAFRDLVKLGWSKKGGKSRNCPVCTNPMNRMGFGEAPFIILDRCPDHGLWMDRAELKKVVVSSRNHAATMGLMQPPPPEEQEE